MKTFTVSYRMPDGKERSFSIKAKDWAEAEVCVRRIRGNATLDGELILSVPAPGILAGLFR